MTFLRARILLLLLVSICTVKAHEYFPVNEDYCKKDKKIFECDYSSPKKELLLSTENENDIDKVIVSNFPKLTISSADCKNLTVISSNISFAEGPVGQCQGKVYVLRNSYADKVPKDVTRLIAYKSYIIDLDNSQLKFASIHNSTIKSVGDLTLLSADITVVNSIIASMGKVYIDENSSVKFVKSEVSFNNGGYLDVRGELTLESTSIDIKAIHLNPTAKFQMLAPKASWFQNRTSEQAQTPGTVPEGKNDVDFSLLTDPDPSSGVELKISLVLTIWLLIQVFLFK